MNNAFKPYLLRAFYEWVVDEGWTPHIAVSVDHLTQVPAAFVKNNQIVLNISTSAAKDFFIHNDGVAFQARFSGVAHSIWVPIGRISSIFARESEEGMTFEVFDTPISVPAENKITSNVTTKKPVLKVVK
jgi:stringent starvation protein B